MLIKTSNVQKESALKRPSMETNKLKFMGELNLIDSDFYLTAAIRGRIQWNKRAKFDKFPIVLN